MIFDVCLGRYALHPLRNLGMIFLDPQHIACILFYGGFVRLQQYSILVSLSLHSHPALPTDMKR